MKKRPTQVWYPAKVLPWSALTLEGWAFPVSAPAGCYGFTPMFESAEEAQRQFPDDVILSFRLDHPRKAKKVRK